MVGVSMFQDLSAKMDKLTYDTSMNGKVDVVDVGAIPTEAMEKIASDTLRHSIDAIVTATATTYAKLKTLTLTNGIKGVLRIKFNIYNVGAYDTTAILTQNGAAPGAGSDLGSVQTTTGTTPTVKSQDITVDIPAGETIDLWVHTEYDPGDDAKAKEFRIYYDNEGIPVAVTGAD